MIIFDTLSITYTKPKIITGRFIDVEYTVNEKGGKESVISKVGKMERLESHENIKNTNDWKIEVEKSKPKIL